MRHQRQDHGEGGRRGEEMMDVKSQGSWMWLPLWCSLLASAVSPSIRSSPLRPVKVRHVPFLESGTVLASKTEH